MNQVEETLALLPQGIIFGRNANSLSDKISKEFMEFINTVFDDGGGFKDIEFPKVPGAAKKNCKFCEFGNRGICDKKATK